MKRDEKGRFVRTKPDYKALYEAEKNEKNFYFNCYSSESKEKDFLLDHCPFWVRWMYRKQFEKGGKN